MEKELDEKNKMVEIQQIVMDAAVKDYAAIVVFLKTFKSFTFYIKGCIMKAFGWDSVTERLTLDY